MKKKFFTAILSALLACSMVIAPVSWNAVTAMAETGTDKTITGPGTGAIGNPASDNGGWAYVYYGKYDGTNATKYRVLAARTTNYGGTTMLLDCDSILYAEAFNDTDSNVWADSSIKAGLNGERFLNKPGNFTAQEIAAIAESTKAAGNAVNVNNSYLNESIAGAALNGEKIFILEAEEAYNPAYGYKYSQYSQNMREKTGANINGYWWLRSPSSYYSTYHYAAYVAGGYYAPIYRGQVPNRSYYDPTTAPAGVSPAFNIDLSRVIFSTLISGTAGNAYAEYKLTLKDDDMKISSASNAVRNGNIVTVPYTISGKNAANATQVSVLLMDSEYTEGTALTSGYAYLKLDTGASGTGTFTLPNEYEAKECGTDYHAYILAEDVNGEYETDYASAPAEITISGPAAAKSLDSIEITTPPKKTEYYVGDSFDPDGMIVTAHYNNNTDSDVTEYTYEPEGQLTTADTAITVSYTEGDITKTVQQPIKVNKKTYSITLNYNEDGGYAEIFENKAEEGTKITVRTEPNRGYEVESITYTPEGGSAVDITSAKSFTMPDKAVTVNVAFKSIIPPGKCGDNVTYNLNNEGILTISGTGDMYDYIDFPPGWRSKSEDEDDYIKSVVIENGVTRIGSGVFASSTALENITIPDSVTSIGDWAFNKCDSLKDVNYNGTQAQWDAITIGKNNKPLLDADIHVFTPEPVVTYKPGDVNNDGSVNAKDKAILNRYLAGWKGYDKQILSWEAADIDKSGKIDAKDKAILNRKLAGWAGYDKYFE